MLSQKFHRNIIFIYIYIIYNINISQNKRK